jgi:HSF-type DNA-binding
VCCRCQVPQYLFSPTNEDRTEILVVIINENRCRCIEILKTMQRDSLEDGTSTKERNFHFPSRLHGLLQRVDANGWSHIVSWQPHGRAFLVHKKEDFVKKVLPS